MTDQLAMLSSFQAPTRAAALRRLAADAAFPAERDWVNMHMHTFFSYSGEGWSPSRVAWEMKQLGLHAAAICDFDVLDGVTEFLEAADLLGLRAAAGFESRVFFQEYADQEINSPGEPGVFYFMGMGFVQPPAPDSPAAQAFADMLGRSHTRNRDLIARINAKITRLQLDYDRDVLPLTPKDNATERHIIAAFQDQAVAQFGGADEAAEFWAETFSLDRLETAAKIADRNAFAEFLRGKLIKRGGIGYQQPNEQTFPLLDDVIAAIRECRAIPMCAWLDGDSQAEQMPEPFLQTLVNKGVAAVNIIPDRNWNFKDREVQARKIAALDEFVRLALKYHLPVNIGTEGNKPGQRLVDDFSAEAIRRHHQTFLQGARIMVGHTLLRRYAGVSYIDQAVGGRELTPAQRQDFFARVGALPAPPPTIRQTLEALAPERAFSRLADAAAKGAWQ